MQLSEERAEIQLQTMGGSLTIKQQRGVLRRLIEAEDKVVDLKQSVGAQERCLEMAMAKVERLRQALQQIIWQADATDPLSVKAAEIASKALDG